jgi:hypothetical protein
MKKIRITKKRLYIASGVAIFIAAVPLAFKSVGVADEVTMKVLEFFGTGFGLTLGGYLLGAGLNRQEPPPNA